MNQDEALAFLNPQESPLETPDQQESMSPDEVGPQYVPQVRASGMSREDALNFLAAKTDQTTPRASDASYLTSPVSSDQKPSGMSRDDALAFLTSPSQSEQTGKTINLPAMPWYENLAKSTAAQTTASFIRQAEGFERAGAAPVTDLSRVNAPFQRAGTSEEVTSTFDKSIADQEALLSNLQSVADKKGFVSSDLKRQMDAAKQQIGNLQIQKQQTLERPEYSEQAQQELLQERQQMGQEATQLEQKAKGMFPYFGVNASDESVSAQIGRGVGTFAGLAPAMVTGPLALPIMATQGASQAYAEGYNEKEKELKKQGVTNQGEIDKEAHQAGSQAAVGSVPQLAAYMVGGALTTKATSALLKGSSPIVKGLVGGTAAAGVNLATSGGLRMAQGGSFAPTTEQSVPDILFGAIHGVGSFAQARAEAKAKIDASIGGPEPKVKPSENSAVNEREAQILAGADAQASVPEGVVAEPTTTVAETKASETAPAPDLTSLILDQTLYDEGSAEWNAIQAQIDALKKPAGEIAPIEEKPEPKWSNQDKLDDESKAYWEEYDRLNAEKKRTMGTPAFREARDAFEAHSDRRMQGGDLRGKIMDRGFDLNNFEATAWADPKLGLDQRNTNSRVNLKGASYLNEFYTDPKNRQKYQKVKLANGEEHWIEPETLREHIDEQMGKPSETTTPAGKIKSAMSGLSGGISDVLYKMLWGKVTAGDVTELGKPSAILTAAKTLRERGGLTTIEEFRSFANEFDAIRELPKEQRLDALNALAEKYTKPAEAPAEAQPTPTNAIQVTSATETMLRPQGEGASQGVELSGVGEQKPEVPAKEAEAPKEEVVVPSSLEEAKTPEEVDAYVKAERQRFSQMLPINTSNESINIRNRVNLGKRSKALGMEAAERKRQITGNLTAKEAAAKAKKEASNYVGKPVSVDGKNGTVIGNPFGRVKVRFSDGTETTHLPEKIEAPVEVKAETPTEISQTEPVKPEEVKSTLSEQTQNEFIDFARKQGGLTKAQAQKALAEYEKAGNITIGDNGEMLFTKPENSTRESLRKAAGIEEAQTASKSQPIRDLLRRFQSGEEDSIDTLKGLADAVSDLARKTKNKRLTDLSTELDEAVGLNIEIEDAQELVDRSLAAMEDEASVIDSPKKGKQSTRQKRTKKDKAREVFGNAVDSLSQVLESKILDPIQYKRMVKSGMIEGGGEYDFFYNHKFPKKVRELIFSKTGERIDVVSDNMGFKDPTELLTAIDDAYRSAERINEETKALEKDQSDIEENFRKMEELKKTDPEAHASAVEEEVRTYLTNQLRREGGYTELPQIIYDAAVSVGRSVAKAARDFKSWSGEMVSRLGDGVKGYLRQIWGSIKGSWNKDIGGGFDTGGRSRERAMSEAERYGPKAPTEQEAFAKKAADAILKGTKRPITEEEMGRVLAKKFPGISPAEVADLYATASGKPKPSAAYAGGAGAIPQGEMFSERTTGLKKAVVKEERLARGLEDIPVQERQSEEERVQRAVDRVSADPSVAPSIISRIVDAKQPNISVDDAAALLVERNRLMNDRGTWDNVLDDESKSPAERNYAKERLDQIEKEMERLDRAQRATGSEWGRLGRIYQRMIKEDYSLEAMERKERRNLGRPLEKSEREAIKKEADSIKETVDKLDKAREELSNAQEKDEVRDAYWKTIKELEAELATRPKIEPQIQRIIDRIGARIKTEADAARERIEKRKKENAGRLFTGVDVTKIADIADWAIIGADYIRLGATDIAKFTSVIVKNYGEQIRPFIKQIFDASQKRYDNITDSEAGVKSEVVKEKQKPQQQTSISEIKATGKAEKVANPFLPNLETLQDPLTHKLVYELARQHILEGVKGEDNVMKAVHNDIKDVYPDATERDVRRAFSEYAKVKFPSTAVDRVALAEIRTLTRLQESIDRLEEGLPALRTGLQRNKATQEIREKQKKLNELLKKVKLPPTAEELASRDAAKQTALRNRIADLEKQLRTGEKVKRTPAEPDSQATEDLRLEKNALEQLLKEVEGKEKPQKTPEERYNENRQKAIRKKIAEIQNRIDKGLYEKPPKRIPKPKFEYIQRLELELKRKQNEFERRQLKHLEERKPRWQKLMQGTSEMAKGFAITGYHSLEKILGFDLAKLVTTPIEEFTGAAVSLLPGMKAKEGQIEIGGTLAGRLKQYYGGQVKGAKESLTVYKTGLSESEELFGKVRPNVARWYDFIGGRLHAAMKHVPFTGAEEMYRYTGLANAEKVAPGSTKNDLVRTAIYKAAYERAQAAKLQEANAVAESINDLFRRMEQPDTKTGKAKIEWVALSTAIKVLITKQIIKTPANYFKQVYEGGTGLPKGVLKYLKSSWNGLDNLTPTESDAIYKAFKVGGIGFSVLLYGYIDSFKDKKDRVFGGYYQAGRKEGDGDAKWGTMRINGTTFHLILHNPVTELGQFGSTIGRVQQSLMKKTDMPTAIATGLAKSMISLLGNAPVSGPLMRLGQPYSNPVNEIAGGLVPALISNIATDTDEGKKRKATNPWEAMKVRIPGLRQTVPVSQSGKPSSNKPFYKSSSSKPFYKK